MPVTYITTNTTKRLGADLRQFVHSLKECRSDLREIVAVGSTMIDGANYTLFETEFGLPTGTGQPVASALADCLTSLETPVVNAVITRLG
jgi:hypothetical protein